MSNYWWFTEEGRVCLGTKPSSIAGIVISTELFLRREIKRRLTDHEMTQVGDIATASAEDVTLVAMRLLGAGSDETE